VMIPVSGTTQCSVVGYVCLATFSCDLIAIDILRPRVWHFGHHFLREKIHVNSAVKTFN